MAHAKLSPSAADRWAVCTASPEAEAPYPDTTSEYAQEGTEAHDLLERAVKAKTAPKELEPEHHAVDAVQVAYEYLEGYLNDPTVVVLSETRVDLTEDCWGTADVTVLLPTGELIAFDYKHGRGVVIEADCRQLLIYGVAAWKSFEWMAPASIKKITTVVCQPRAPHADGSTRALTRTLNDAIDEVEERVYGPINKIASNQTEFVPSEKGCKFCKHAGNCPALAEKALEGVRAHFTPTGHLDVEQKENIGALTAEQKAAVMEARPLFKTFLAAIEEDVEKTLAAGGVIPGFKMVAGRSNRCFDKELDEEQVIAVLRDELKLKQADYAPPKLLGPAPIEKLIDVNKRNGKKKMERLQEIIIKPEGKPTVVPESDKRPAIKPQFEQVQNDPLL